MNSEEPASSSISLDDIYNFPFPHKLWIAVNSITCDFIKWNIDGTQIELQLLALDNYLSRPQSIFKIKSRSSFVSYLRDSYAFQLIKTEIKQIQRENSQDPASAASACLGPDYSEVVMHFSHMHFLRHRIDLLANIRKSDKIIPSPPSVVEEKHQTSTKDFRLEGDLCSKSFGSISSICKAQFRHQLILNFISETKTLERKLKASEISSKTKGHGGDEDDSMIELPAELFENPHDSVLYMADDHRTAYAGFYGNCSNEQVSKFFGPYLPMYDNDDNDKEEKRIGDLNPTAAKPPSPQSNSFATNFPVTEEPMLIQPPEILTQQMLALPTASSSLEPIFIPDVEKEEEKDEDILMDEFIKFHEQTGSESMPPDPIMKTETTFNRQEIDEENEANFKNFFSQYRESLSLLYENH